MSSPSLKNQNIGLLITFMIFNALLFLSMCLDTHILDIYKFEDKWQKSSFLFLSGGTLFILFLNLLLSPNFKAKIVFFNRSKIDL